MTKKETEERKSSSEACDLSRYWRIWVCRCPSPGHVWPEAPRHYTCTLCGASIGEITVYRGPWQ